MWRVILGVIFGASAGFVLAGLFDQASDTDDEEDRRWR